jgi:hypothetical protein
MDRAGNHRCLDQVFLFGEFHTGTQDLFHRKSAEDDTCAPTFIRRLDDELVAQRGQIEFGDDRLVNEWRQDHRIGCVNARRDQLQMHGRFVFRPLGDFRRVNPERLMLARPAMNRFKTRVVLGTIEDDSE